MEKRLYVHDPAVLYNTIKGVFTDFAGRLASGASSIALNLVLPQSRPRYQEIFDLLGADLPGFVSQVGAIDGITGSLTEAELAIVRTGSGTKESFFIYLIRLKDGIWRIDSM